MIRWMATYIGSHYYQKNKNLDLTTWINGFKVLFLYVFTIVILVSFGLTTSRWEELIINLAALIILRLTKEGRHFSIDKCLVITNGLIIISSLFSLVVLSNFTVYIMILLQLLLIVKHLRQKNSIMRIIIYAACVLMVSFIFNHAFILVILVLVDHLTVVSNK